MKIINVRAHELRERIGLDLGQKLAKSGFTFKKSNSWFVRSNKENDEIFYLLLHTRTDHYAIEPFLFVKSNPVEKILKRIVGSSTGITIGNSVGIIYNSPDGRQTVNNLMEILLIEDADIESALETLEQYYNNIARPFFDKYCNLTAIDDIYNNPPFDHNPAFIGGMFDDRFMRGLIIARLVNNPAYEKLESIYSEAIKSTMNEKSIADFEKVREYLMYNRVS